ncbi:MAG TPA: hypothetical protein VMW18_14235 [Candidatus Binatia bacterium]|nr:hypothetical protein [Candidatus Binatia bacterium]
MSTLIEGMKAFFARGLAHPDTPFDVAEVVKMRSGRRAHDATWRNC